MRRDHYRDYTPNVPLFTSPKDLWPDLGDLFPLCADFAELLLQGCDEPEIVFKRYTEQPDGSLDVCDSLSLQVYYPGGDRQTLILVVDLTVEGQVWRDYYQLPYHEVPDRGRLFLQYTEKHTDDIWFVAQVNNRQLHQWMIEGGVMQQSNAAIEKLNSDNPTLRNQRGYIEKRTEE